MKFIFTKHAIGKFMDLEKFGWKITRDKVKRTVKNARWRGKTRYNQPTAMSLVDAKHILRVVFEKESGIIRIITFHIARRGKYESAL